MKKLLSVLGAISISASGGSALLTTSAKSHLQVSENKNISSFASNEDDTYFQINNLKETYILLSESEKISFANEMAKLPELKIGEIHSFLENSKLSFVQENRETIEMMYMFSLSIINLDQASSFAALKFNLDWKLINQYINLDFGDSNDYIPQISDYGPSVWWKVWEWGWQADLPEGLVNLVRVVNLIYSLYGDLILQPIESLVLSAKEIFDYLVNLDAHGDDKMSVLYNMLVNTENDLKTSGIPFTNQVYDVFDEAISEMKKFEGLLDMIPISLAAPIIKQKVSEKIGIPFEEIGPKYSNTLNSFVQTLHIAKEILDNHLGLPDFIWNFFSGKILKPIVSQIVNADQNHNGVYIQFQQHVIPLGFKPR